MKFLILSLILLISSPSFAQQEQEQQQNLPPKTNCYPENSVQEKLKKDGYSLVFLGIISMEKQIFTEIYVQGKNGTQYLQFMKTNAIMCIAGGGNGYWKIDPSKID